MIHSSESYARLSIIERERLFGMLKQGKSLRAIAKALHRSHSSLGRELKRNCKFGRAYLPSRAQSRANRVACSQRSRAPLKDPENFVYVREKLRLGWTPEQIAGRLRLDKIGSSISHTSIYNYIYSKKSRRDMFVPYLKYNHSKQRTYGKKTCTAKSKKNIFTGAIPIDQRPKAINMRIGIGHWETDLMESTRSCSVALSVTVERKARFVILALVPNKSASAKENAIKQSLHNLPFQAKQSITIDRGVENKKHSNWGLKTFVCNPYHSWEKGSVENTIGRIRYSIPKGTNLDKYSNQDIAKLQNQLNNTPRKVLNYHTPAEVMLQLLNITHPKRTKWCTTF